MKPLPLFVSILIAASLPSRAEDPKPEASAAAPESGPAELKIAPLDMFKSMGVKLVEGPVKGVLGPHAEIQVPEGFFLTDGEGCRTILKAYGNLVGEDEVGFFAPASMDWFVTFDFDDVGYVKDDEKDKLDADAMLKSIREGNAQANEFKKSKGMSTFTILGFAIPPRYNPETNNLEFAIRLKDDEDNNESVNFQTKILGRRGVMVVTLVCDPTELDSLLPVYRGHMETFAYKSGGKYAEYRQGDKVAKYGLTALVVGGGVALAAKSGLLGKLLKPILLGVLAVGAGLKKLFSRGDRSQG